MLRCPSSVRVLYIGQEVGLRVMHGAALTTCASDDNPARAAYLDYLGGPHRDRFSWDPLMLLVAVRGVDAVHPLLTVVHPLPPPGEGSRSAVSVAWNIVLLPKWTNDVSLTSQMTSP